MRAGNAEGWTSPMSIQQRLDSERDLTVFTVSGPLLFEELRSTLESVYSEPDYSTRSLFDMRDCEPGGLSAAQIESLVGLIGTRRPERAPSHWAIVTMHKVHFGLSRMFEAYASNLPVKIRVFHDLEEAVDWLERGSPHGTG